MFLINLTIRDIFDSEVETVNDVNRNMALFRPFKFLSMVLPKCFSHISTSKLEVEKWESGKVLQFEGRRSNGAAENPSEVGDASIYGAL